MTTANTEPNQIISPVEGESRARYDEEDSPEVRTAKCIQFELENGSSVLGAACAVLRDIRQGAIRPTTPREQSGQVGQAFVQNWKGEWTAAEVIGETRLRYRIANRFGRNYLVKKSNVRFGGPLEVGEDPYDKLPVTVMDLSVRLYNAFRAHKIETVGQASRLTKRQFMQLRNLGKRSWAELQGLLQRPEEWRLP